MSAINLMIYYLSTYLIKTISTRAREKVQWVGCWYYMLLSQDQPQHHMVPLSTSRSLPRAGVNPEHLLYGPKTKSKPRNVSKVSLMTTSHKQQIKLFQVCRQ